MGARTRTPLAKVTRGTRAAAGLGRRQVSRSCCRHQGLPRSEASGVSIKSGCCTPGVKDLLQLGTYSVSRQPSAHCFGGYDRCFESRWSAGKKKNKKGKFYWLPCTAETTARDDWAAGGLRQALGPQPGARLLQSTPKPSYYGNRVRAGASPSQPATATAEGDCGEWCCRRQVTRPRWWWGGSEAQPGQEATVQSTECLGARMSRSR